MNNREIASIACKILSVNMIIQGIYVIASTFSISIVAPSQTTPSYYIGIIFPFIFLIFFGVLLWFQSDKLAVIMAKGEVQLREDSGLKASDVQRILFSVLGLYLLGSSLPKIVSLMISLFSLRGDLYATSRMMTLRSAGEVIAQFFVGLVIFFGSQGLVNLLIAVRYAGLKKEEFREKE